MWQVDEQELTRFRCHTGHVYYGEGLLEEQTVALEAALWTAVRTFREKTILAEQMAASERRKGRTETAARFEDEAKVARRHGDLIQQLLMGGPGDGAGRAKGDVGPVEPPAGPAEA
jgi:two-component system chemotaxis response regulator CheB